MTFRVLDLTTTLAGAYGAHLLATTGVDVTRVEPPDGHPLRRWSATGAEIAPGGCGPLFRWLAGGTSSVVVDPTVEADVVELLERAASLRRRRLVARRGRRHRRACGRPSPT